MVLTCSIANGGGWSSQPSELPGALMVLSGGENI